ncbi:MULTISPECIES: xanthine dehydrogenase family protein molybdopterin-binding subunit [Alphaproteobacteria]|uniref:Aldehyde dehydrogenase n=2 Tax=Alphaproteobacteria TaxID=28211 RepID=A0A512HL62_9HYPH|nr:MULTISPECIES: xanthine dehydrogenase family protein molybdopterin-binding subunit [Alphaproteobacteria]GEO86182.1 aldehyde dehydrogenase [Ciceribacter naphthalenivorans]GLR22749.1 aldehyde dehydrogenase [Ciceribacter naphthalenivorans]GLT05605.1 aldehyde dehydrogenase [Sphingomonas psychrolutea]
MSTIGKIARRTFLFGTAAVAGGVAFGYYSYTKPFANPLKDGLAAGEATFNPYVKIGSDGKITIIAPRAEMGQGSYTTLAALVCEELDVRLDQVSIEHGPPSPAYFNAAALSEGAPVPQFDEGMVAESLRAALKIVAKFVALQFTGGSTSMADGFEKMRYAGAGAREALKEAAARKLGVATSTLQTADGVISHPASGRSLSYGALASDAATIEAPSGITLRDRKGWKILGKPQPRKDMRAKVTGAPIFGVDVTLPDMLYGTVRMNPSPGGKMKSFDATAALAMPGVTKVVAIDSPYGQGIGVIADNTWRAFKAAEAVDIKWEHGPAPANSVEIDAVLKTTLDGPGFFTLRTIGDPDRIFADAPRDKVVEAEYDAPYLAHAAMEPMNATARLKDDVLEVWAPNQAPTLIQVVGTRITGLPADRIRVHTTFLGGGFGRRIEPDFSDYAIRLAREGEGRPVKVTWTREEDMTHGPYRPVAKSRYRAVLGGDGMPRALTGSVASPSVAANAVERYFPDVPMGGPDNMLIDGAYNQPYGIENYRIDGRKASLAVPVGFWRSVGYSYNTFMHESFIDEIAHIGGKDPLELRRALMSDFPVALGVIDKVATMVSWSTPPAPGRARGLAFALSFGTWVAQIIEVSKTAGTIRIEKVWCAADPGIVLDPLNFKAQMMSGIIYGLSAAVGQQITFADGVVEQSNFHAYDALRMNQSPAIEVELLENAHRLGGAGEPGTPPSMPALGNAIFALTGKRLRALPFSKEVDFA